jgi:hypothetical protein
VNRLDQKGPLCAPLVLGDYVPVRQKSHRGAPTEGDENRPDPRSSAELR